MDSGRESKSTQPANHTATVHSDLLLCNTTVETAVADEVSRLHAHSIGSIRDVNGSPDKTIKKKQMFLICVFTICCYTVHI